MSELTIQERAVRIARVKMRGEQLATMETQYVLVAAKTGEDLLWLKSNCGHGEFKTEFAKEFPELNYRRASDWMRIAKEFPELLNDSNVRPAALLSITQVIELLGTSEEVKTEVLERIESGEDVSKREIQRLKKEAADLLAEKQAVQNDLIGAKQQADELQRKVNFQKLTVDAVEKQNNELRNRDQAVIDAKVAEAKAQLILENQQAIADAKRERDNAQSEIERLRKERDVQIKNGIEKGLQDLDVEIRQKQSAIDYQKSEIEKLSQIKREIDVEVGALAIHKKAIERIKDNLSFLTVSFSDAFETNVIPVEVSGEWDAIFYAVSKLKKKMAEWRDSTAPLESAAIIGELVD